LVALNHFTVPVAIVAIPSSHIPPHALRGTGLGPTLVFTAFGLRAEPDGRAAAK
jgi:hypothetical protein